jgi:hypothetical protein
MRDRAVMRRGERVVAVVGVDVAPPGVAHARDPLARRDDRAAERGVLAAAHRRVGRHALAPRDDRPCTKSSG